MECDENQHRNYSCEKKRTVDLVATLARPTVFIRFNPDKCEARKTSCFSNNKNGSWRINKPEWRYRTSKLVSVIQKYLATPPRNKLLSSEYLFYD